MRFPTLRWSTSTRPGYYHGHKAELDAEMERRAELADRLRQEMGQHPAAVEAAGDAPPAAMIRFYMDENAHGGITSALRDRGLDILTVQDEGRQRTPDPQVLDRATELGRVLFTQDDDLLAEASRRQRAGEAFAGVVFAHQRLSVGQCVECLELIAHAMEPAEFASRVMFLPL